MTGTSQVQSPFGGTGSAFGNSAWGNSGNTGYSTANRTGSTMGGSSAFGNTSSFQNRNNQTANTTTQGMVAANVGGFA